MTRQGVSLRGEDYLRVIKPCHVSDVSVTVVSHSVSIRNNDAIGRHRRMTQLIRRSHRRASQRASQEVAATPPLRGCPVAALGTHQRGELRRRQALPRPGKRRRQALLRRTLSWRSFSTDGMRSVRPI